MSISVMTKVWECPDVGGGSELLALLALADWSDDDGRCWPSIKSVSKKIRLQPRQAQRVVHQLIEDGFLSVIGNMNGGAPGMSRQYRINLKRLTGVTGDARRVSRETQTGVVGDTQTTMEPSIEPSVKECADGAIDPEGLPEWLDQDHWASYVRHYHELQNMKGKTVPDAWEAKALRILSDLIAQGEDQTVVLERAINSYHGLLLSTRNPSISHPANGQTPALMATH
jgi:hypothetical protein